MKKEEIVTVDGAGTDLGNVTAVFADRESAEAAYNVLLEMGYPANAVTLAMSQNAFEKHFGDNVTIEDSTTIIAKDATIGSAIGGTVGAIAGLIAALGVSVVVPGVGLVVAGPVAGAVAGAGAGSIAGGLLGALANAGIPEAHASIVEKGVKKGHIAISFRPQSQTDILAIEQHWKANTGLESFVVLEEG